MSRWAGLTLGVTGRVPCSSFRLAALDGSPVSTRERSALARVGSLSSRECLHPRSTKAPLREACVT